MIVGEFVEKLGVGFVGESVFAGFGDAAGVEVFVFEDKGVGCGQLNVTLIVFG